MNSESPALCIKNTLLIFLLTGKMILAVVQNKNPEDNFGVTPKDLAKNLGRLEKRKENEVIVI